MNGKTSKGSCAGFWVNFPRTRILAAQILIGSAWACFKLGDFLRVRGDSLKLKIEEES
jgi:hypothetical protein